MTRKLFSVLLLLLPALCFASTQLASSSTLPASTLMRGSTNPWTIYIGGFGGYYGADFGYEATYFGVRNAVGRTLFLDNNTFQHGVSGGGQIGIQYHPHHPYYYGIVFSAAVNANTAYLTNHIDDGTSPAVFPTADISQQFKINDVFDMAGLIGLDITPRAHLYAKVGASYGKLTHELAITRSDLAEPLMTFQSREHQSLWGWLVGLGFAYDFNKWLNIFTEYDYHNYARSKLTTLTGIFQPLSQTSNVLAQHATISASSLRIGLNLKFMDASPVYHLYRLLVQRSSPWSIYVGGFGGSYSSDFSYSSQVFLATNLSSQRTNQILNDDVFQEGGSGGGQIGVQYHLRQPYYFGAVFSLMSNTGKALLTSNTSNFNSPSENSQIDINNEFKITSNLDIAGLFGIDLTPRTHFYTKLGGSLARLTHSLFTTRRVPQASFVFTRMQRQSLWGWLVGLGLTYDINNWVSAFTEYDYYDYGVSNPSAAQGVFPVINANQSDRIDDQHVRVSSSSIRLGLNIKLLNTFSNTLRTYHRHLAQDAQWSLWAGGFGGYYDANFAYSAHYDSPGAFSQFPNRVNMQTFNTNVFQQGVSGGGQIGVQYHLRSPYYVGMFFSAMANSNKAKWTDFIENILTPPLFAVNFHNELSLNNNYDLTALFGVDITPETHAYIKIGASAGCLRSRFFVTSTDSAPAPVLFEQIHYNNIWGGVAGMGVSHDINKWLNVFAEYDYYNYGAEKLKEFIGVTEVPIGSNTDSVTQHVSITADSIRLGLNAKFDV